MPYYTLWGGSNEPPHNVYILLEVNEDFGDKRNNKRAFLVNLVNVRNARYPSPSPLSFCSHRNGRQEKA